MWAKEALERLLAYDDVKTVLDVGSGSGEHAQWMRDHGREVTTIDLVNEDADYTGFFEDYNSDRVFDAVWASHVLEHAPNVQCFIHTCTSLLRPDGLLAITVPPAKHDIVGGHLTLWNQGLLLYNLVLAGLDCSEARVSPVYEGYNISVLVRKRIRSHNVVLKMDAGDIEELAQWFPMEVAQGFRGDRVAVNW